MEEKDWNIASNKEMKEELERLNTSFQTKQGRMKEVITELESLDKEMNDLSRSYVKIKEILDRREGKKK